MILPMRNILSFLLIWVFLFPHLALGNEDTFGLYTDDVYENIFSYGDSTSWSYIPSDAKASHDGYYTTKWYSQVREGIIIITPKPKPKPVDPRTPPKPKPKPPEPKPEPPKRHPEPPKKPEPKKEVHKNTKKEEKRYEPTQAEKEKKAEDAYYATHTKKFTEHAVFDEVLWKWVCSPWYLPNKTKNLCIKIEIPKNAELNEKWTDWVCKRGYRKDFFETGCEKIEIPMFAHLNKKWDNWECNEWYIKSSDGESCIAAKLPPHATQNIFSPIGWSCDFGYTMQEDYTCKK